MVSIEALEDDMGTYKSLDTSIPVEMEDPSNAEHCVEPEREMQDCAAASEAPSNMNASAEAFLLELGRAIFSPRSGALISQSLALIWYSQKARLFPDTKRSWLWSRQLFPVLQSVVLE